MPYIVTTAEREACPDCGGDPWSQRLETGEQGCAACSNHGTYLIPVSRRAVATLEEAREAVKRERVQQTPSLAQEGNAGDALLRRLVPESGGTVGPLPDGTVIEVERVEWWTLAREVGQPEPPAFVAEASERRVLDAFNARQSA